MGHLNISGTPVILVPDKASASRNHPDARCQCWCRQVPPVGDDNIDEKKLLLFLRWSKQWIAFFKDHVFICFLFFSGKTWDVRKKKYPVKRLNHCHKFSFPPPSLLLAFLLLSAVEEAQLFPLPCFEIRSPTTQESLLLSATHEDRKEERLEPPPPPFFFKSSAGERGHVASNYYRRGH